jgi:hypothetical protein
MAPEDSPARQIVALILLGCGIALYLFAALGWFSDDHRNALRRIGIPIAIVLIAAAVLYPPQLHRPLADWLDRVRHPSAARRRWITSAVWLAAALYLALTALRQHRDFGLRVQDEMMYLVQVRMLAAGHLYMPAHPMADFFQTFYIFTKPVYASMYFPGASLMFVPAVWLHLPMWIISLAICGGVVAMTYRIVAELTDGVWGMLAAMLVIGVPTVRTLSLLVLSYMPMALLGLLLIWAYLHFRRERRIAWAAVIGLIAGWAAITRPLDAICFAAPVGVAMLLDLRRECLKQAIAIVFVSILCAAPFLSLQLLINHGVTGRWLQTPVQKYEELYWPGVVFGFHPHVLPGEHPLATSLPQFKDDYDHFVLPWFTGKARLKPRPFAQTLEWTLPQVLFIVLLPIGLLGLRDPRRRIAWAMLLLFPTIYFTWVMFLPNYAAVVAPLVVFAVVLGAQQLVESFPARKQAVSASVTASIFLLAILSLPELSGKDKSSSSGVMQKFNQLSATIHRPAVVFFRYPTGDPMAWRHEQTYNIEAASIDDEPIVRAQDLGERNLELVRYYAKKQLERTFYSFDQQTMTLKELGTATQLEATK